MSRLTCFWSTLHGALVKYERRLGTIRSGACDANILLYTGLNLPRRTLATDRGFKERVREDMLVRLLDAFVWRNHGMRLLIASLSPPDRGHLPFCRQARDTPSRIHICARDERAGRALLVYHAVRT